jgi:hypothetical protein
MKRTSADPIGVFDSGVGGLSVLRALRGLMPAESVIYIGDQIHIIQFPTDRTDPGLSEIDHALLMIAMQN